MKTYAIILASGSGTRMELDVPKQFYKINNKTLLEYSIEAFENHEKINAIVVVANPEYIELTKQISFKYSKVKAIVKGGSSRQKSSYNGIMALAGKHVFDVLIHDAVRPFVSKDIITRCIDALKTYSAVNVAVPVSDTIIQVDDDNIIKFVPQRKMLKRCQTPQCFRYSVIKEAHELANNENYNEATDDCSLVLRYDLTPVYVTEGSENNIKITYPSDIKFAEKIILKSNIV